MAKRSSKTIWLIAAVLVLIAAQVAVLGFVVARSMSRVVMVQNPVQQPRKNSQQGFPPPVARPLQGQPLRKSAPMVQKTAPKPKPTGPRAEPPQFSNAGGIFTNAVRVELTAKSTNAIIHYTVNGSDPTEDSPTYSAPILVNNTMLVRAACFEKDKAPSISITHTYTMLDDDLLGFSSNLPLVII